MKWSLVGPALASLLALACAPTPSPSSDAGLTDGAGADTGACSAPTPPTALFEDVCPKGMAGGYTLCWAEKTSGI